MENRYLPFLKKLQEAEVPRSEIHIQPGQPMSVILILIPGIGEFRFNGCASSS